MTKRTLQGTKRKKISHTGFLARMRTNSGRHVIKRRKNKGRKKIGNI